jgi:RNA recognition motif-containing protein
LITNQQTGRSKGYAFIEFTNYKEFQTALSPKEPIIFGKQKLVFNSAKNRYDNNDNILKNNKAYHEENKTDDFYDDDFNQNTFIKNYSFLNHNNNNSNIRISGISDGNTNNSSYISQFQGEKNKLKQTENNILSDNSTHSQIKY